MIKYGWAGIFPFLLVFLLNPIAMSESTISFESLKQSHMNAAKNVLLILKGFRENNVIIPDPESIELASQYMKRAEQGTLYEATPSDVNFYYQNLMKRRTEPLDLIYLSDGTNKYFQVHSDAGYFRPWEFTADYIFNGTSTFYIHQKEKIFNLCDSNDTRKSIYYDDLIDPMLLLFPLSVVGNKENVEIHKEESHFFITYKDTSPESMIQLVEAYVMPDPPYCVKQIKVIGNYSNRTKLNTLIYAHFNNYKSMKDLVFPMEMDIKTWLISQEDKIGQNNQPPIKIDPEQFTLILPKEVSSFHDLVSNKFPPHIRLNYFFDVVSIERNDNIDSKRFWPDVPSGYSYYDMRSRYDYIRLQKREKDQSREEKELVGGVGPHVFEK